MGFIFMKSRFVRYGVPFLALVVGGSFGLREFAQLRYDFRSGKRLTKEEAKEQGIEMKDQREVTLETEFEKIKTIDTGSWENVRGPRPWEEGNRLYEEALQRSGKMAKKDSEMVKN
ncbi:cytochrome c oxidase assembly protein COX16 homolog, mitochondrial [Panulirus ornatus]|uniref:cytochrome c oxidase assembly protein COX16 homolog, mitochondrial n=1 Tax=Panulirus ornatus TaxID=150431 RepID=UPI003A87776D